MQLPLHQDLNGVQLTADRACSAGIISASGDVAAAAARRILAAWAQTEHGVAADKRRPPPPRARATVPTTPPEGRARGDTERAADRIISPWRTDARARGFTAGVAWREP